MTGSSPEERIRSDVRDHGWHVVMIPEDAEGPAFAYTIGLTRNFNHPELIMFGLTPEVMHNVLNTAAELVKAGSAFRSGAQTTDLIEGYACTFAEFPGSEFDAYLGYASWFYGDEGFSALQCVWPDRSGRYPWDDSATAEFKAMQPVPGGKLS